MKQNKLKWNEKEQNGTKRNETKQNKQKWNEIEQTGTKRKKTE
jgi:hypothetical protein